MKTNMFTKLATVVLLAMALGCTTAQKGAGIGAVTGGAAGAIIGNQSGNPATGAAIGAGAGAVGGALIGERMDTRYCPECGRRYTSGRDYCAYDGTALRRIER